MNVGKKSLHTRFPSPSDIQAFNEARKWSNELLSAIQYQLTPLHLSELASLANTHDSLEKVKKRVLVKRLQVSINNFLDPSYFSTTSLHMERARS